MENIPETPPTPQNLTPLWEWIHEAKGLFTSVRGFSQLLLDGKAGVLNDEQRVMLEIIDKKSANIFDIWFGTVEYLALWLGNAKRWSKKESISFEKMMEIVKEVCDRNEFQAMIEGDRVDKSLNVEVIDSFWLYDVLVNLAHKRLDSTPYIPHIENAQTTIHVSQTDAEDIQIQIRTNFDLRQEEQRRSFYEFDRRFILANLMLREYGQPVAVLPLDEGARFSFVLSRRNA